MEYNLFIFCLCADLSPVIYFRKWSEKYIVKLALYRIFSETHLCWEPDMSYSFNTFLKDIFH